MNSARTSPSVSRVRDGRYEGITDRWRELVAWREDSPYKAGTHQWLERSVPRGLPGLEFDLELYLPIAE